MPSTNCYVARLTCPQETSKASWCVKSLLVCLSACMCACMLFRMHEWVHVCTWIQYLWACACTVWVTVDCRCMDSLCKCVWISPLRVRLLHFRLCMCWQKKWRYTTGCIMKSERQLGNWSGYQSLPLCLCAFVWWPSKASIAILASHRIGLLYKNTPASILQGWSGAEGVGAAGGEKEGSTEYSSEMSLCLLSSEFSSFQYVCPSMSFVHSNKSSLSKTCTVL